MFFSNGQEKSGNDHEWSGNDVLPSEFFIIHIQSTHLMQITFKIFSNHGGQFNKGNSTHLIQVTFKMYPLCLEINIKI